MRKWTKENIRSIITCPGDYLEHLSLEVVVPQFSWGLWIALTNKFTFPTNNESVFILYTCKTKKLRKWQSMKISNQAYKKNSTVSDKGGISCESELTVAVDSSRLPVEYWLLV